MMLQLLMFKDRLDKQLQERPSVAYWESHQPSKILSWTLREGRVLWRKIKHAYPILILYQGSAYVICWKLGTVLGGLKHYCWPYIPMIYIHWLVRDTLLLGQFFAAGHWQNDSRNFATNWKCFAKGTEPITACQLQTFYGRIRVCSYRSKNLIDP